LKEGQIHNPVLLKEVVENIVTNLSGNYFEGTSGFGGHSKAILDKLNSDALFIGVDKDFTAFTYLKDKFKNDSRVKLYNTSFVKIKTICKLESINKLDGILLDLGVSSFQLDNSEAGFTYKSESPLDMRMDKTQSLNAADIVNSYGEKELADIFFKFGEEKNSRKIASEIIKARQVKKISTTTQLKEIILKVIGERFLNKSLSRIFQSLRIAVNNELDELSAFIDSAVELLNPGGRIAIITFHSLEDRIVKDKFRYESLSCTCPTNIPVCVCGKKQTLNILTKKPIVPEAYELEMNPRARSSKLRIAEKL
jgi:16S rRNA (cytosine1402-N4)-methyltransferase